MSEQKPVPADIPILTDVVTDKTSVGLSDPTPLLDSASLIAELQTQLAANAYALTEEVLHSAFAEMEATMFEQVSRRLREELPELIDRILREHLGEGPEDS